MKMSPVLTTLIKDKLCKQSETLLETLCYKYSLGKGCNQRRAGPSAHSNPLRKSCTLSLQFGFQLLHWRKACRKIDQFDLESILLHKEREEVPACIQNQKGKAWLRLRIQLDRRSRLRKANKLKKGRPLTLTSNNLQGTVQFHGQHLLLHNTNPLGNPRDQE
jgi:hypothetical protein